MLDLANYTSTIPDFVDIVALNITMPILSRVPSLGQSTKSIIDFVTGVIYAIFVIHLIGSGISFILSAAAIVMPNKSIIYGSAAAITTITTMLLQTAVFATSGFVMTVNKSINNLSDTTGLSSEIGSKYLAFIWIGYIAAFVANSYWTTVWFVEFRLRSYKARARTAQQMGDYKGAGKEILSDIRLQSVQYDDTERLVKIEHYHADGSQKPGNYEMM